ncbi:MAG TPA: aliphatic sulfonate ABC transporter substrate-binding protein [Pseudolysinimonas sp.]|nr:aliphatic sulfonate ABC transporter substrate-binding protein [Pseudolysinimonas sp.]
MSRAKRFSGAVAVASAVALMLAGCGVGGGTPEAAKPTEQGSHGWSADTLRIDYAAYNPLSLIIKDQGWLEKSLGDDVKVTWVESTSSSQANRALRSGSLDVGSTAGSAALLARSTGSKIKAIDIFSQPNWAAIVVPKDSAIKTAKDLVGKNVAVARGTDPYFFLLQTLAKAGIGLNQVTIQDLPHAEGRAALESGKVDAWSGLDPLISTSVETAGSKIVYDNPDFCSYGFLNATESFLSASPDLAQLVVNAYEKARAWAEDHTAGAVKILAKEAGISTEVASSVLNDRTDLNIDPVPGKAQTAVLKVIGPFLVESGEVKNQALVDKAVKSLYSPSYAEKADPNAL